MSRMEIFVDSRKIAEIDTADLQISVRPKDGGKPCYEIVEKPAAYVKGKQQYADLKVTRAMPGELYSCGCESALGRFVKVCPMHQATRGVSQGDPSGILR